MLLTQSEGILLKYRFHFQPNYLPNSPLITDSSSSSSSIVSICNSSIRIVSKCKSISSSSIFSSCTSSNDSIVSIRNGFGSSSSFFTSCNSNAISSYNTSSISIIGSYIRSRIIVSICNSFRNNIVGSRNSSSSSSSRTVRSFNSSISSGLVDSCTSFRSRNHRSSGIRFIIYLNKGSLARDINEPRGKQRRRRTG